jgi:hypothetical protein
MAIALENQSSSSTLAPISKRDTIVKNAADKTKLFPTDQSVKFSEFSSDLYKLLQYYSQTPTRWMLLQWPLKTTLAPNHYFPICNSIRPYHTMVKVCGVD